ncbi:porin [Betaproteobacteria bacterium]|nr:porin [Betaproteobacteria bacterium]
MQKKIIALAVAGLVSGAAFAQSNVTIYGVADIGYNYAKSGDNRFSGLQDGGDVGLQGSRIGFRGEEALGNGLKAIFTVEFGLNLGAGEGTANWSNTRQSYVGLAGNFGTVKFGRQYAPSGEWLGGTSVNGFTSVNFANYFLGNFATLNTGNGSRWNNSIGYESPNFSGFTFRGIYSFHPTQSSVRDSFSDATTDGSRYALAARYANGPVYLTAIYQAILTDDAINNDDGNKAWAIGGSYDFKVVKVFANYIREKDKRAIGSTTYGFPTLNPTTGLLQQAATTAYAKGDLKKTLFSLGAAIPVSSAGTVQIELGQYKTDASETKSRGGSIGYKHALSKRTTAYTYVTRFSNQDNTAGANRAAAVVGVRGESQTSFAVGLNHNF